MSAAGLSTALTGAAPVRTSVLRDKLGASAWFLLQAMWRCRDWETGETRATNTGLSRAPGFAPLALRVVRKAAARLKAAGLVECVGWRRRVVRSGFRDVSQLVYVRVVRGGSAFGVPGSDALTFVPEVTRAWLKTACGWGGARRSKPAESRRKKDQEGPPMPVQEGPPIYSKSISSLSQSPERTAGASPATISPVGPEALDAAHRLGGPRAVRALLASFEEPTPAVTPAPRVRNVPPPTEKELGGALGGNHPAPRTAGTKKPKEIPVYPGFAEVGWPVVPPPPLLAPAAGPIERAAALLKAYRGAVKSRYGVDPWGARGPAATHRHYRALVEASEALVERKIAPAAWAAWSCDAWRTFKGGKRPPPIPWVFSAKRIDERAGWFASEESGYTGGKVVAGPKYLELLRRYQAARFAVDRAGPDERPRRVFERFFPGDAYPRLLAEARAEVAWTVDSLRKQADLGVFLWD